MYQNITVYLIIAVCLYYYALLYMNCHKRIAIKPLLIEENFCLKDILSTNLYIYGLEFSKIYCLYMYTVCPGSSDPPEKRLNIFASENEVYTIF